MTDGRNIHATGLVLGTLGLLFRGPSGAGKSLLALALLDRWSARGLPALLVSDDRLDVRTHGAACIMDAPPALAGQIELRGRGIVQRPHVGSARIHLVIDLVHTLVRMLDESELRTDLFGVEIARAPVPTSALIGLEHQILLVSEALRALDQGKVQT